MDTKTADKDKAYYKNYKVKMILSLSLVILIFAGVFALTEWGKSLTPARTVTVSADSKVAIAPDLAEVSFSVITEGANPTTLQIENTTKMNAAIQYVKGKGIEAKDVKTSNYNLQPKYEYDRINRTTYISGYTLTQTIIIKIRDLSKIAEIVAGLPGLGVNEISSVRFSIEDPDKFLADTRKEAFDKAFEKAKAMASMNRVSLGKVVGFSESTNNYIRYDYSLEKTAAMGAGVVPAPVPTIEPGSEEITVYVTVIYEIK
ncbi:MAG TPA: SIMPL domain-containing protein [Candidatus Colwellbacteria bacterium]|nr:SIMPL domain-containing protein [Candidatus Colwellbacteria bacterium]HQA96081.1 SIMPL domain-containing protein [Candidatus Colwellbacteria bacterium]